MDKKPEAEEINDKIEEVNDDTVDLKEDSVEKDDEKNQNVVDNNSVEIT